MIFNFLGKTYRLLNQATVYCCLIVSLILVTNTNLYGNDTLAKLSFNHITSADGLPQNTISTMLQDKDGFLWLGTHDGLHRYDGYEFTSYKYDSKDPSTLSSNVITALFEDPNGGLWVGTGQGGLNYLNTETGKFTRYQASADDFNSLSHNQITALHIDKKGRLWVGTFTGLNLFQAETNDFVHFYPNPFDNQSIPDGSVSEIASDGGDHLYVATTETLAWFDTDQLTFNRYDSEDSPTRINTIYLDEDKSLWVGTQLDGLYHLRQKEGEFTHFTHKSNDDRTISSNNIQVLLRDSNGNLWVGTEQGGLNLKPRVSKEFYRFQKNPADSHSISINDIWSLLEDHSGQIWIGTPGGGINKVNSSFQNFSRLQHSPFEKNSLSHNFIWNMEQDSNGDIWLATLNGIDKFDPKTEQFSHYRDFIDQDGKPVSNRITALELDNSGGIWFGNQQGQAARFDPKRSKTQVLTMRRQEFEDRPLSENRIRFITSDSTGDIWISADEGLAVFDHKTGEMIKDFGMAQFGQVGISIIYTMFQDEQGIMWFGTWDSGLQRYDPEFKETQTFRNEMGNQFSLSDNTVRSIYQDNQGNLWIGTFNGLNLLRHQDRINGNFKFYSFDEDDGLPNNSIYGITSDDSGYLWLSTNRGISRFDPKTSELKNFTSTDGLPADEFNGNSVLKSSNGLLYFGSVSGVAVINPYGLAVSQFKPKLVFTEIIVNEESVLKPESWKPIEKLKLEHNENNLKIKFSALDLQVPKRVIYSYRLIPYEDEWRQVQGDNIAVYGNLTPGEFTFQLKSTNSDEVWFEDIAEFKVTILPPLWATWWAYGVYMLLLLSIIGLYIYRHARKLREQQEINEHLRRVDKLKDEFLANTSHELRTPLNGIIGIAESLREGIAGPLNNKAQGHLNLIIDSGKRLAHQVNEILDFKKLRHHGLLLNKGPVDLRVAAKVVINLLKPLAEEKQLQLTNSLPQFLPPALADENRIRQVLYNLLGNAIKYTDSGFVELTARVIEQNIEVCIKDSGVGIPEGKQKIIFKPFEQLEDAGRNLKSGTGLGLAVTRQLVELHQGKIWLKSKAGSGSSFYFTLPISDDDFIAQEAVADTALIAPSTSIKATFSRDISKPVTINANSAHILVVDDDALNRQVLNDFLTMHKYHVTEAVDGQEAVDLTKEHSFDLIILDVMMPRMSGFEATELIRKDYSLLELPILLLSAKNQPDDINTGLALGANDYISKPIDRSILMARVSNLLALREVFHAQEERLRLKTVQQTCDQLSRYFPRLLVEKIMDGGELRDIQPERRCITVLFADLVGFTEFSDRFEPETVTDVLNEFLSNMSQIVAKHNGLLNEVLGDGLVILFGALEQTDKEAQALRSVALAKEMQVSINKLTEKWRATGLEQHLQLRIGIHQSYVTLGNFGSEEMIVFRAVGSGVNLASRIQSLCEPGEILASYPVFAQAESNYEFEEFDEKKFKGFNHSYRIFKLIN
ncbi:MAG: response regulator [Gammaproteobacteria bacterium]|nr:response regulator [Gammaproteobacteria bacterium]